MQGDTITIGGMALRFLVDETQGSGELVMFELTIAPHARVPVPHFHRDVDEVVYGLSGTLTSTVDGKAHEIGPGGHLLIRRGQVHHHANPHEDTARALFVLNPGSIGKGYFAAIAQEASGARPDPARMKEIMLAHGLIPTP
jgi:quercetin dioxygenase-like cupin family protein